MTIFFVIALNTCGMSNFNLLDPATIYDGRSTDAYFLRTEETLDHAEVDPSVTIEVTADQFPTGEWEVFAGLESVVELLEGHPVTVQALPEGRVFDGGPVMRLEGRYRALARFETAILGLLSQASGFATRAMQARMAAPEATLVSFGSRHLHPGIAPVLERSALLAGFDGISNVAAGEALDREASGTMPHALIICYGRGNQEEAWAAFDEAVDPTVPRIALCDTFSDEVDEVLRAAETLGESLESVRIDTTGSRRGDFRHILREIRWELDSNGYEHVDLFASGGIDVEAISKLSDVVEGFGVGSYITNADPIDFALDIVEVDGAPLAKRGKLSGKKSVYRTRTGDHAIQLTDTPDPDGAESLLTPALEAGRKLMDFDLDRARDRALADAELVGFGTAD